MSYERMLDRENQPNQQAMVAYIGKEAAAAWDDITAFLAGNYDFTPETTFGGKKYGWAIRYRRSGKTLCTLFPEKDAFTVLVVLGSKETELALASLSEFSPAVAKVITSAHQYHDGRWLWPRVLKKDDTADIKRLLQIKKRPRPPQ